MNLAVMMALRIVKSNGYLDVQALNGYVKPVVRVRGMDAKERARYEKIVKDVKNKKGVQNGL